MGITKEWHSRMSELWADRWVKWAPIVVRACILSCRQVSMEDTSRIGDPRRQTLSWLTTKAPASAVMRVSRVVASWQMISDLELFKDSP